MLSSFLRKDLVPFAIGSFTEKRSFIVGSGTWTVMMLFRIAKGRGRLLLFRVRLRCLN